MGGGGYKTLLVATLLLFITLISFTPLSANSMHDGEYIQRTDDKPLFMRDDFYTNSNANSVDSTGQPNGSNDKFDYRKPILNTSFDTEKGKILATQIGHENNFDGLNTESRFNYEKQVIAVMRQIIRQEQVFNESKFIKIKNKMIKE